MISLLLVGCAREIDTGPASDLWSAVEDQQRIWPEAPSAPRIRHLRSIGSAADLGFKAPAFEQLFEFIVGKDDVGLTRPYGIAVEGRLLVVADPGDATVHFLDLNGKFYKRISGPENSSFLSPVGIAIGGEQVFVSDSALNKVFVFDLQGVLVRELDGLERPTGLAYDPATRRLYVAETLAHRIAVFSQDGTRLFNLSDPGDTSTFNTLTHIAFHDDMLLVNDTMNFRLVAMNGEGRHLWSFGTHGTGSGHFSQSKGVDVDAQGRIYVADAIFNRVQIFDREGNFLLAFGGPGHGRSDMWLPAGVFVEGNRIFVADSYNRRVQVYEYVGEGVE